MVLTLYNYIRVSVLLVRNSYHGVLSKLLRMIRKVVKYIDKLFNFLKIYTVTDTRSTTSLLLFVLII